MAMKIQFECGCGKQLVAPKTMAGRRVKCPQCGKSLEVPQAKEPLEEAASVDNEAFLENLFGQNVSGSEETLDTEVVESRSQQST